MISGSIVQLCSRVFIRSAYSKGAGMATAGTEAIIRRLVGVQGGDEKTNDVVFCGCPSSLPQGLVVFFGGDIQDYPENMLAHRDNKRYIEHNVENTARLLGKRFPSQDILLVKPDKMYLKTFSVYSSFVESSDIGNPEHTEDQGSWMHLSAIVKNSLQQIRPDQPLNVATSLVGFSKGCVVLNQLLYDLSSAKADQTTADFVKSVKDLYWLDGGHNGGSKVWITDEAILEHLSDTGITVHSHVTPYQMRDPMRKWICKEHKKFLEKVKKYTETTNKYHFEEEERSIDLHFRILDEF